MRIPIILSLVLLAVATPSQDLDSAKVRRAAGDAVAAQDWETAVANFRKLVKLQPDDARAWHMLGYSLHAQGKLDEALEVHLKATEFPTVAPVASYNVACVYALRGDKDQALAWLGKAVERGFSGLGHLASDPDMDVLRDDPRYGEIVDRLKSTLGDQADLQVFSGTFDRKLTRIVLFGSGSSAGGASIAYGQPTWQEKYDALVDSEKRRDHRWRFGRDEWTTLDCNVDLKINRTEVPAGIYYLTLHRRGDGAFVMACLDPAAVHARKLDPYVAHLTSGGIEVELDHQRSDEVADHLQIDLQANQSKPGEGKLLVRFGPHRLSAPLTLKLGHRGER